MVAFVRLSFNADKDGYVYGSNKELSNKIGMSVAKVKKLLRGYLRNKCYLSVAESLIWKHEDNIEFAEGEESKPHKNEPERIALNNVPSVQQVDDKAKKVCEYFNKVIVGRGMPLVHALTSKRKSMINSRLKEYGSEQMKLMIDKAAASSFLNGSNGWMASFDWIMRPNNLLKYWKEIMMIESKGLIKTQSKAITKNQPTSCSASINRESNEYSMSTEHSITF